MESIGKLTAMEKLTLVSVKITDEGLATLAA